MLSDEQINALGLAVARGEITEEHASGLVRRAILEGSSAAPPPPAPETPKTPWADSVAKDTRIDLERVADFLQRTEGMSSEQALKQAIRMAPADAAPLAQAEANDFAERAERAAERDWKTSPAGIESMGRERQAQAARDTERAEAMRVELAARGMPVEGASTEEILGIVDGIQANKEEARVANDLQANIAAASGEGR